MAGRGDELPDPLPFRDFVAQARLGVSRAEHERYFAELLGDVTEPTARSGCTTSTATARRRGATCRWPRRWPDGCASVARRLGTAPATVLHVAWARVLATVSGRDDVVFGTVLFGRMNAGAGADRVQGMFMNTLPLRVATGAGAWPRRCRMHRHLAGLLDTNTRRWRSPSGPPGSAPTHRCSRPSLNYRHNRSRRRRPPTGQVVYNRERTDFPILVAVDDDERLPVSGRCRRRRRST